MYVYLLFILFGIMIFLLLNKYNTFSVGNQFSMYNEPCTCLDEFNIPFQTSDDCLYSTIIDSGTGERERIIRTQRKDFFGNECMWTGDTSVFSPVGLTFDQLIQRLYNYNQDIFERCLILGSRIRPSGQCQLINGIILFFYLLPIPIVQLDIDYIIDLFRRYLSDWEYAVTDRWPRELYRIYEYFMTKPEAYNLLSESKFVPIYDIFPLYEKTRFSETIHLDNFHLLQPNKLYAFNINLESRNLKQSMFGPSIYIKSNHRTLIYYFIDNDNHKLLIIDENIHNELFEPILKYNLNYIIIDIPSNNFYKEFIIGYAKLFKINQLYKYNIINFDGEYTMVAIPISIVYAEPDLNSDRINRLNISDTVIVIDRRDIDNAIFINIRQIIRVDGTTEDINGWVNLARNESPENFRLFFPDLSSISNYDDTIFETFVNKRLRCVSYISFDKINKSLKPIIIDYYVYYPDLESYTVWPPRTQEGWVAPSQIINISIKKGHLFFANISVPIVFVNVTVNDQDSNVTLNLRNYTVKTYAGLSSNFYTDSKNFIFTNTNLMSTQTNEGADVSINAEMSKYTLKKLEYTINLYKMEFEKYLVQPSCSALISEELSRSFFDELLRS